MQITESPGAVIPDKTGFMNVIPTFQSWRCRQGIIGMKSFDHKQTGQTTIVTGDSVDHSF